MATTQYPNISLFIVIVMIFSNLTCISTMSNDFPPSSPLMEILGKQQENSRTIALKQHKYGTRVLSPLDKLAMLNHNEKINSMEPAPENSYRKNAGTGNQNYLLPQPRILQQPPAPPSTPHVAYYTRTKPFNKMNTKPPSLPINLNGNNVYENNSDSDNDDYDSDDDERINAIDVDETDEDDDNKSDDFIENLIDEIKLDKEIALKSSGLLKLLLEFPSGPLPVIYIEENDIPQIPNYGLIKRGGRYNQRYPWKRENARYRKESMHPETRFHCIPSREEVFRLLIGLHENRSGNQPKTVRFCNKRRPARSILTSIRFMG